ncbi:Crp/Fnr family transcriptional regulator [Bradyrhizobium quebecense]|uniref:Crp/Fnr family transcriptional regulator n=2 Tax=Bradyrhizobium quebecense TaxID=2748629 RepID=A0A939RKJ4_9BRAD|nr:Crp/Fnr family transcriptional regulator [Bradyrhizobium quebecense]UGA46719.1 Crp/Fnr family transcriptional regulator [Bradyrhizobium quebecense]UGY03233.1 Crp/Fnr family transcriptional regulator [Bradyrhizobium quebecense]
MHTKVIEDTPSTPGHFDNELLAALPKAAFEQLAPKLTIRSLSQRDVWLEVDDEIADVAFPHSGIFSLQTVTQDGKAIETATVGREGVVGAMAALRQTRTGVRVVVQAAMTASTIPIKHFRKAVQQSDAIRDLCIDYNEVLLTQARVTAACNALHSIVKRVSRRVLQSADRSVDNRANLTQELLAEMLGVRRTSISETANELQRRGLISYSRGAITILDRSGLEEHSCDCYQTLRDHARSLR